MSTIIYTVKRVIVSFQWLFRLQWFAIMRDIYKLDNIASLVDILLCLINVLAMCFGNMNLFNLYCFMNELLRYWCVTLYNQTKMSDIYTVVLLLYQGTWCLCLTLSKHYENGVCNIRCDGNHAEKCGGPDDFVSVYIGMKKHLSCVHFTYDKRMQK